MKTIYQLWMINSTQTNLAESENEFDLVQKLHAMESAAASLLKLEIEISAKERLLKKKTPTEQLVKMWEKFSDDSFNFRVNFGTEYDSYDLNESAFEIKKTYKLEIV